MSPWIMSLIMFAASGQEIPPADAHPASIRLDGEAYLALDAVARLRGGAVRFTQPNLPLGIQPLTLIVGGECWQFPNGGDRVLAVSSKKEFPLSHSVVFYRGGYYVEARELAPVLGYEVREEGGNLKIAAGGRSERLDPARIDSPHRAHKVEGLRAIHRPVRTTARLRALPALGRSDAAREIPAGAVLLARREAVVGGVPSLVVSDCGPDFRSYVVQARALEVASEPATLSGTEWEKVRRWFDRAAEDERGLRRGDGEGLDRTACLTVDLCWSLRPFEPALMTVLREAAEGRRPPIAPVLFLTGRWMEQHPGELHELIELSRKPGLDVTWGLHSFEHPKYGNFLNDYPRERLQADDLRQERLMLEWGLVPSVYYRFPGLIHDRERLRGILDLDLLPIDCDSWSAIAEARRGKSEKGPFGHPITDGSIILVHGNGNEPGGIPPFLRWLREHPEWKLGTIRRFLPAGP